MFRWIAMAGVLLSLASGAIAQSDHTIKAGDTLGIEVLEDPSLNRNVLVLPDGSISFPPVGVITASGFSVGQLQSSLTQGLDPSFASTPSVYVSVVATGAPGAKTDADVGTIEVILVGETHRPGAHAVARGTTIETFLGLSLFTRFAAKTRLQLSSTSGAEPLTINYKAIEDGSDTETGRQELRDGDVIIIPERRLFED